MDEIHFLVRGPDGCRQLIQVCADAPDPTTATRELRSPVSASTEYPDATMRLVTLTRDALPEELPARVVGQPASSLRLDARTRTWSRGRRRGRHRVKCAFDAATRPLDERPPQSHRRHRRQGRRPYRHGCVLACERHMAPAGHRGAGHRPATLDRGSQPDPRDVQRGRPVGGRPWRLDRPGRRCGDGVEGCRVVA